MGRLAWSTESKSKLQAHEYKVATRCPQKGARIDNAFSVSSASSSCPQKPRVPNTHPAVLVPPVTKEIPAQRARQQMPANRTARNTPNRRPPPPPLAGATPPFFLNRQRQRVAPVADNVVTSLQSGGLTQPSRNQLQLATAWALTRTTKGQNLPSPSKARNRARKPPAPLP